ncbi:MAG: hypothetical protein CM15mP50_4200 [Rhodobacterales bacterium]|nr:MAG: hypothetical protein CM15mP50_4200 [Rhodobacterales bacterium]
MILIIVSNWQNLKDGFKKPELIIAKVTLNNECSILSDAFVVIHQKTKRIFNFSNNLARIKLYENDMIRLAISPKYPITYIMVIFLKRKKKLHLQQIVRQILE